MAAARSSASADAASAAEAAPGPGAEGFVTNSDVAVQLASLTFKDLSFSVNVGGKSKTILEPCSGHLQPGQLAAIMGPSGSGKTTLLDIMAMKKTGAHSGEVFVNGLPRDSVLFPRIAGYVPQEDLMPAYWKVREAVEFNAVLKQGHSRKQLLNSIDGLLATFGLLHVADSYVGGPQVRGISGGERRRVTVARGVVAKPSILFLDEPTSGLSAADAALCVAALRPLAKVLGVLVVAVIHQPRREIAEQFDTLILLTSSPGRLAYFGPMSQAKSYMEKCGHRLPACVNPTDWYLDLVTPGCARDASSALVSHFASGLKFGIDVLLEEALAAQGRSICDMLRATRPSLAGGGGSSAGSSDNFDGEAFVPAPRLQLGPYAVSFGVQFRTLLHRKTCLLVRDPAIILVQFGLPVGMGCFLGMVFQGVGKQEFGIASLQCIFIMMTMVCLRVLPMMATWIEERLFMKLEASEMLYSEGAHILATALTTTPLSLVGAALQTLIIYFIVGFAPEYLPTVLGWMMLCFLFFDSVFQCLSAFAASVEEAMVLAVPLLVVTMLFNGLVVAKATAPAYFHWVFFVTPTAYAMQEIVLCIAEDAGQQGKLLVASLGYEEGEGWRGIAVIVIETVILRVIQIFALKYLNAVQR